MNSVEVVLRHGRLLSCLSAGQRSGAPQNYNKSGPVARRADRGDCPAAAKGGIVRKERFPGQCVSIRYPTGGPNHEKSIRPEFGRSFDLRCHGLHARDRHQVGRRGRRGPDQAPAQVDHGRHGRRRHPGHGDRHGREGPPGSQVPGEVRRIRRDDRHRPDEGHLLFRVRHHRDVLRPRDPERRRLHRQPEIRQGQAPRPAQGESPLFQGRNLQRRRHLFQPGRR